MALTPQPINWVHSGQSRRLFHSLFHNSSSWRTTRLSGSLLAAEDEMDKYPLPARIRCREMQMEAGNRFVAHLEDLPNCFHPLVCLTRGGALSRERAIDSHPHQRRRAQPCARETSVFGSGWEGSKEKTRGHYSWHLHNTGKRRLAQLEARTFPGASGPDLPREKGTRHRHSMRASVPSR